MAMQAAKRANIRLPPEVNRILYIRNLPYKITAEEMYDIFGKYGPIRQIRTGNTPESRGTAYVVYEDIFDAKNACDHLSGFNVCNRYLVVLYYNANRAFQKMDTKKKEEQLKLLKEKYGRQKMEERSEMSVTEIVGGSVTAMELSSPQSDSRPRFALLLRRSQTNLRKEPPLGTGSGWCESGG
uniref:Splicing factor 3B subunit 6 n=1 Tax=Scophthalmus maximus TaxID=52904 RepID=A0A8D2ZTK5_SCOMX